MSILHLNSRTAQSKCIALSLCSYKTPFKFFWPIKEKKFCLRLDFILIPWHCLYSCSSSSRNLLLHLFCELAFKGQFLCNLLWLLMGPAMMLSVWHGKLREPLRLLLITWHCYCDSRGWAVCHPRVQELWLT